MRRLLKTCVVIAVVALLGLAVAGCEDILEHQRARTCRVAAVGLGQGAVTGVVSETHLPPGEDGAPGIRLALTSADPDWVWLECRFAPASSDGAVEVAAIRSPAGPLSEPRLFALRRFWLASAAAAHADPGDATEAAALPSLPGSLAYALQQTLNALPEAAVYGLLATAYALVYGLSGRITLAFGGLAAAGGYAALTGAAMLAGGPVAAILAVAAALGASAAAFHGAAVERLTVWPLRRSTDQQGLVASLGVALFLDEYLRLTQGSQPKWVAALLASPLAVARAGDFTVTVSPLALILAATGAAATLALLALLRWSRFGRDWRATADDAGAAALFGIDPGRLSLHTFVLASSLVGLAGAGVTLFFGGLGSLYTTTLGLKALIGAVVGGIGSVPGAALGGIAIALIEAFWSAYLPVGDRDLVVDVLLVVTLVFRPGGLFGYGDLLPRRI